MAGWRACLLGTLLAGVAPGAAHAQVFLAPRPNPAFTIGPLFVRASVGPELGPVTVEVLWSLVFPAGQEAGAGAQDLYLVWPAAVTGDAGLGAPEPELARYVEARGAAVIDEGRAPLLAQSLQQMGKDQPPEPVPGGAPFVTFVRQGGPLGLTAPATYIRIPATSKLASRDWQMNLRLTIPGLITPKKASWVDDVFRGDRYVLALSFNDVRSRALFPLYFEHRDRVVRLAEDLSQLLINFASADRLKIDEVSPPASPRRLSESLENTEVVSHFLDRSEGVSPQVLTVQFGYLSGVQAWGPILIPTLFFVLGNLAAVLVRTVADRVGRRLAWRFAFWAPGDGRGRSQEGVILSRDTLARLTPGVTTHAEVLQLCGRDPERLERLGPPERHTLVYRGRRVVPQGGRWRLGWLMTVSRWEVEHHEVEIDLERGVVSDVKARVRRSRLDRAASG
jgi:hypothetical protein